MDSNVNLKSSVKVPLTAVIITLNEELFIKRCISNLCWADQIIVVDSESIDNTRKIAADLGAMVICQPWLGWIRQKEIGISYARNDWILIVDVDEVLSSKLVNSIQKAIEGIPDPSTGFAVDRRDEFAGVVLSNQRRRAARLNFVRLFNRKKSGYDPNVIIHEVIKCPGNVIQLDGIMLHWRSTKIKDIMLTFLRNVDTEVDMMENGTWFHPASKKVGFYSLIMKPLLRFSWVYFICGGWRRGSVGFVSSLVIAQSEFIRQILWWERSRKNSNGDACQQVYIEASQL